MKNVPIQGLKSPNINYRFLQWSPKSAESNSAVGLIQAFVKDATQFSVPLELFHFDLVQSEYHISRIKVSPEGHLPLQGLLIIATTSSAVLDELLLQFDIDLAGHLRDSGPNAVFDHKVIWPIGLEPGPSDILLVTELASNRLSMLIQRRLLTSHRLEEIRNGS